MAHLESSPPDGAYTFSNDRKPLMSITLPRNFAPMGLDGRDEPRTPDQAFGEITLPPPPHHSTHRIRRNPFNMDNFQARNNALPPTLFASEIPVPSSVQVPRHTEPELQPTYFAPDTPVPSIELPQPATIIRPTFQHSFSEPPPSQSLRLPDYGDDAPTTPPAQTKAPDSGYKASVWEMERSSSVSSMRSDDSYSSIDTFMSRPTSFGGSATSPDVDLRDPFGQHKFNIIPDTPSRRNKKLRTKIFTTKDFVKWTIEMDNHLFNIYQMYLGDPTVTPFKTVPGSIPPSGVCRRVARRSKELWPKASKIARPIVKRYKLRNVFDERNMVRDKTPEPNDFLRVRESTPISFLNEPRNTWPSESSTRKRLRQLCKEKFTITAHYQRLRESRSPSPFTDSFARRSSTRVTRSMSRQISAPEVPFSASNTATYATRELGISLVASGATAPLAQLMTGESPPTRQDSDDFFNTPVHSSSQIESSPAGLGIDTGSLAPSASGIPRLASPFNYSTWNGPARSNRQHRQEVSQNQFDTVHITGHRLLSPVRLEPDMSSNANKRRAQHTLEDELSPNGSALGQKKDIQELIFTGAGDISQRRIRLRNRGATLGSTTNNQNRLDSLFTPPATNLTVALPFSSDIPSVPSLPTGLAVPEPSEREKRLGSPFELDPNKRSNRSRTPRHIPSMSDPFISSNMFSATTSSSSLTLSIGERLAQFTALHQDLVQQQQQQQQQQQEDDRLQNPF